MLKVTSSPRYSLRSFVQEGQWPNAKLTFTNLQLLIAISRPMWTKVLEDRHWASTVFLKTRASSFTGLVLSSTPLNLLTTNSDLLINVKFNMFLRWRIFSFVWFVVKRLSENELRVCFLCFYFMSAYIWLCHVSYVLIFFGKCFIGFVLII